MASPGSDAARFAVVRGVSLVERGKVVDAEGLAYPECPSHGVVLRIRAGGVSGGNPRWWMVACRPNQLERERLDGNSRFVAALLCSIRDGQR